MPVMIDPHIEEDPALVVSDGTARQFAALCGLLLGAAAVRDVMRGVPGRAGYLAVFAVAVAAIGVLRPGAVRPFFMAAMAITAPIRIVVSALILGILYYGVFTPLALAFRLAGRDALSKHRRPQPGTHWVPKPRPTEVQSYFRQS